MESGKGTHLRKEELMMVRLEDVRTEDTGGWDDPKDMKAERFREGTSVRRIPYRDLVLY